MPEIGKALFIVGALIAGLGLILMSGVGRGWIGSLPGDLNFTRGHLRVHIPIVTCIVLSLGLSLVLWLFRR
jgi:hypothetical protein